MRLPWALVGCELPHKFCIITAHLKILIKALKRGLDGKIFQVLFVLKSRTECSDLDFEFLSLPPHVTLSLNEQLPLSPSTRLTLPLSLKHSKLHVSKKTHTHTLAHIFLSPGPSVSFSSKIFSQILFLAKVWKFLFFPRKRVFDDNRDFEFKFEIRSLQWRTEFF